MIGIKDQCFGVEIELTGITRAEAAEALAAYFETTPQRSYCRSGNRSKQASEKLVKLGYTNIIEIGGINSWPGETVNGDK